MTKDLKTCPFCGSRAMVTNGFFNKIVMIRCTNYSSCGATVSFDCKMANEGTQDVAVRLWNKRRGDTNA